MLVGWLREEAGRKLVVHCAGKGVVFVEADADNAVDELSDARCPPFLFFEEFIGDHIYKVSPPGVLLAAVANQPLVSVGRQTSHCISDVPGVAPLCISDHDHARPRESPAMGKWIL